MTDREQRKPKIVSPRVDPTCADKMEYYFGSRNAGAEMVINAWPSLWLGTLREIRAALNLSRAEAMALLDALNGCHLMPLILGGHAALEVHDADRLNGLGEKWGIDAQDLARRIAALPQFARAAIEWWAAAFWLTGDGDRYPNGRFNDADFEREHLALLVSTAD